MMPKLNRAVLVFLSNNFELKATEIARTNLQHRWKINCSYPKWIKQHLKIKSTSGADLRTRLRYLNLDSHFRLRPGCIAKKYQLKAVLV